MRSGWSDADAAKYVERYRSAAADPQLAEDLALRVYTSRLIGSDPDLVLHGGGNTSVKSVHTTILGETIPAIYVKGSGWDLKSIEPAGFPGLDLNYLKRLRGIENLSDEAMVNELRTHMFDASGPTPSVETLLHAFINEQFVDHTHADAIIALTNNIDSEEMLLECFGTEVSLVPYVMPGFQLSRVAAEVYASHPSSAGMVLLNHGLFTWGATARESYGRHIELVDRARKFLDARKKKHTFTFSAPAKLDPLDVMPAIRGGIAVRDNSTGLRRFVLNLRDSEPVRRFLGSAELLRVAQTGPLTPDHIIRTKELPLVLAIDSRNDLHQTIALAIESYLAAYDTYFENNCLRQQHLKKLDPMPRVILVPGVGLIAAGETAQAASIAADIYEHTIAVKTLVSEFSTYRALPQEDLFEVEYWSLEQAKLGQGKRKSLEGQVAIITGGAGAIGFGIARVLKQAGAEVVITDINNAADVAAPIGCVGLDHDVASPESTREMLREVCKRFGGVDILVPNAGVALSKPIESLSPTEVSRVMDVNFNGCLNLIQEGGRIMKSQRTGGNIVIVSSKNVLAPGREFGIYSASKAAAHQLGKIAAMEYAPFGIRVNMITPDAVFKSEDDAPGTVRSGLWREVGAGRAKAHKIELTELENFYRNRNLLKSVVTAEDVGRAVLFFASSQTPTTGATLPVDGGVPEAFPR